MSVDKIRDPRRVKHLMGHMETDYAYTLGIAGERFLMEIKENTKIMGTECKKCGLTYVPPRMFCERCFEELTEWVEMSGTGTVHSFTVAHIDVDNTRLKEPIVWAMIEIDGAHGGFVHKLGKVKPEDVWIGMRVEAVFKSKKDRTGSIRDIEYFRMIE